MLTPRSRQLLAMAAVGTASLVAMAACTSGHHGSAPATTATTAITAAPATTTPPATDSSTTTSAAPTTTRPPGLSISAFPAPVAAALAFVKARTSVTLEGPTSLTTQYNSSQVADISATAEAGGSSSSSGGDQIPAGGYGVALYYCPAPYPLNDPRIGHDCEFAYSTIGTFGATPEPSPSAAVSALEAQAYKPKVDPCPAGSATSTVDGQAVQTCGQQPPGSPSPGPAMASWHEGEWTFVYQLGPGEKMAAVTGPLIQELQTVALPPHPGWLSVQGGGDGEHTGLAWAVGSTVYLVADYHSPVEAVLFASRMRPLAG